MEPRTQLALVGVAVAVLIGGITYFSHVADEIDPIQAERRIELPDALKK